VVEKGRRDHRKGDPLFEVKPTKPLSRSRRWLTACSPASSHDGDVVTVGVTIAWIVAPGEEPPAELPSAAPAARKTSEPASSRPQPAKRCIVRGKRYPNSPGARRLAEERGVDIRRIRARSDGSIPKIFKRRRRAIRTGRACGSCVCRPHLSWRRAQSPG
jgi:hypothetical protein